MGGLTGFSRGFLTWGVCDALGGALKFSTYEGLKRQLLQEMASHISKEEQEAGKGSTAASSDAVSLRNHIIFALAAVSFLASSVITVPGELLKQHLQMGHYPGCFEAVWHIVDTQGLTGLYSGYDGVLLRDTPYTALELGLYDVFKTLYLQQRRQQNPSNSSEREEEEEVVVVIVGDSDEPVLQRLEQIAIAGLTGGVAGLLTTPFDTIKTKATLDFVGCSFWESAMLTIHDHGPEALFCGAAARVAWLIPVTAIYLPTYDFIKTKIHEQHEHSRNLV
ncbi:mitochondrial carrier protein [Nitzschia inconspicua]|uniref:Mitochondrial carrier protein n=1 Tax=Nitzschia inconspicua TaxID=303405 RepID=A0A9K3PJG0_9STRA|nr:mitochondrial carrier protein [Nitzschia inconspicua]